MRPAIAYYAMFYAAQGLLEAAGEDAPGKTHATTLRLFSQRLVATGDASPELARSLTIAQGFRSRADYTLEGVTAENADEAIRAMDSLLAYAQSKLKPD